MKASVIVLSWNGIEYLENCLNAVFSQDHPDFEVIVVDNGSTDGSPDFVAERFPQVRLIRNERNLGFAGGNNIGLQAATGGVMVLLNQDTTVQPGWLAALAEALDTDPNIGIVGGKALYPDSTIQHAGGYVNGRGEGSHYGYQQREDVGQFDQMEDVDYVTGATLAITRQAFEIIGRLDEGFTPAYYEDVDWCYQARQAGFRVVYVPHAVLVHEEASTVADVSHEGMYLFHRNRLRFVLKHWPINQLVDEFVLAEQAWLEGLDEGGERLVVAVHHAYLYHLLHLADVLAWRQRLLDTSLDEADVLADVLMTLRTVIPLKPARIGARSAAVTEESTVVPMPEQDVSLVSETAIDAPSEPVPAVAGKEVTAIQSFQENVLGELHQRWAIREHPFHSNVPVLGPLITAFRQQWNRISTEWYVKPMIQQQIEFNALAVTMLEHLLRQDYVARDRMNQMRDRMNQIEYDQQRLGIVLAEYIGENGRELGELAQQIQQLKALIEERASQGV